MNWYNFLRDLPDLPLKKILLKLSLMEFEEIRKIYENDERVFSIRNCLKCYCYILIKLFYAHKFSTSKKKL